MMISLESIKRKTESAKSRIGEWLSQGISPRRLALTLALGIAIGCLPMVGVTTALCVVLAYVLKLNLPALQAANYLVMPLQLLLIAPFIRLGKWLVAAGPYSDVNVRAMLHLSPASPLWRVTGFAGQALLAWVVIAVPAVALLTFVLTHVFRRVPALAMEKQVVEAVS